jgi:hypothetical protein
MNHYNRGMEFRGRGGYRDQRGFIGRDNFVPREDFRDRDNFVPIEDFRGRGNYRGNNFRGQLRGRGRGRGYPNQRGRGDMRGRGMFRGRGEMRGRGYNQGFRGDRYYSDNDDSFEQYDGNNRNRRFNHKDDDFGYQNFRNHRTSNIPNNRNQGYAKNYY